jgi:hypothetical protein
VLGISAADGAPELLGGFKDGDKLSEYALVPTATLVSMGVVSGADGFLSPQSAITRAQMAKILCSVINYGGQS